jgi:hypothetical protein
MPQHGIDQKQNLELNDSIDFSQFFSENHRLFDLSQMNSVHYLKLIKVLGFVSVQNNHITTAKQFARSKLCTTLTSRVVFRAVVF